MRDDILKRIYHYRYVSTYLANYQEIIDIIKDVTKHIDEPGMKDIGVHVFLQGREHRYNMGVSKAFEIAVPIYDTIRIESQKLIDLLDEELQIPLTFINNNLPIYRRDLKNNPDSSWILYAEAWRFYILETKDTARLFVHDYHNHFDAEVEMNSYLMGLIKKNATQPKEIIYKTINEWLTKNWLGNIYGK